ncbi:discoidin domain-containing protein [Lysobacter yananisis]|uniref:Discoidin domain-containing protein n=1 Tax=Lysobacter yananisis TaxID=1003114 RepID=A0ABY9P8E2_9GAMM|nr:discoidin domain-containing protein [Lysobacter yananisis]WMT03302.1 discoidin domain-containing protein [Lysobacter yananisis]
MTTKIGTAANYFELLTQLDAFLSATGHAWGLTFTGAGNGRLRGPGGAVGGYIGTAASVTETIHIVATSATSFTVTGTVSGALGTATVGTDFASAVIAFRIVAGSTAFVAGDQFAVNTTPKWKRLRFGGCTETTYRTGNISNVPALFDGMTSTQATSAAVPNQIRVEMGQPTEVRAVAIWSGGATSTAPKDFALEWSDDGSSWNVAQAWTGQSWTSTYQRRDYVTAAAPGAHRYWRVNITAGQTTTVTLSELRLFADAGMKWDVSSRFEFAWEAPGLDGGKRIFVAGYINTNVTTDYFNLVWRGFRFWFDPEQSVLDVPAHSGDKALLLSRTPIAYWFVANGGRVMIVCRVSSFYQLAYIGFGLPFEIIDEEHHPFPYLIGAPWPGNNARWDTSSLARYRNPWDPGAGTSGSGYNSGLAAIFPDGQFVQVANRSDSSGNEGQAAGADARVWPYTLNSNYQPDNWGDNIDQSKSQLALVIIKTTTPYHEWGSFDGLYWITGQRNTAEALERIGAFDCLCIQNINRAAFNHFCAVALD